MTPYEQGVADALKALMQKLAERKAAQPKPKGAVNPWHRGEAKEKP